jgi:hypothetical protein
MTAIFITFGVAFFLGIMLIAVILPIKPDSLRIFGKFVCTGEEKMEVSTSVASYHQPGERSIEIYCSDYGKRRRVKGKTLLLSFGLSSALMLPVAALIVYYIYTFIS